MNKFAKYLNSMCIKQRGFAKKLDIDEMTMSKIVRGMMIPSIALAIKIEKHTFGQVTIHDWEEKSKIKEDKIKI